MSCMAIRAIFHVSDHVTGSIDGIVGEICYHDVCAVINMNMAE